MPENTQNSAYAEESDLYNRPVKYIPRPEKQIGIDTQGVFYDNIINAGTSGKVDMGSIDAFTQTSQHRDTIYSLLDSMAEDPTIAAVLETYAEDATEPNEQGQIVWVQSDEAEISKYITYLLDTIGVDKHIYKWVHSLCKYGDCYLRLYRNSEIEDSLFEEETDSNTDTKALHEDVHVKIFSPNDKYAHYLEMVPNPAEMYELTKFGKSYAYVQAKVSANLMRSQKSEMYDYTAYKYMFQKKDIDIYDATNFVHAALEDNSSRTPEEVQIFRQENLEDTPLTYTVKRGQSLLYSSFKIWRETMLLENSLLLNRLTKSSIVRIINVEVGDMPKENVAPHLVGIKQLIEQKSAISEGNSLSEYTNPGPMENNVYVPTHNGLGAITTQQVGGDVDVKGLGDIDYFTNKLFGSLRIPKMYFGFTDDATGFNGGTSLALLSSRYAKMIKRIQHTILGALTDAVNLMLLDKGLDRYVNKFELHMQPPTTSEEIDRRDNLSSKVQISSDIMNLVSEVDDPAAKLKILKALLSTVISDEEIINIIQEQIEKIENGEIPESDEDMADDEFGDFNNPYSSSYSGSNSNDFAIDDFANDETEFGSEEVPEEEPEAEPGTETVLPTPAELNAGDFTDNTNPEFA